MITTFTTFSFSIDFLVCFFLIISPTCPSLSLFVAQQTGPTTPGRASTRRVVREGKYTKPGSFLFFLLQKNGRNKYSCFFVLFPKIVGNKDLDFFFQNFLGVESDFFFQKERFGSKTTGRISFI